LESFNFGVWGDKSGERKCISPYKVGRVGGGIRGLETAFNLRKLQADGPTTKEGRVGGLGRP